MISYQKFGNKGIDNCIGTSNSNNKCNLQHLAYFFLEKCRKLSFVTENITSLSLYVQLLRSIRVATSNLSSSKRILPDSSSPPKTLSSHKYERGRGDGLLLSRVVDQSQTVYRAVASRPSLEGGGGRRRPRLGDRRRRRKRRRTHNKQCACRQRRGICTPRKRKGKPSFFFVRSALLARRRRKKEGRGRVTDCNQINGIAHSSPPSLPRGREGRVCLQT